MSENTFREGDLMHDSEKMETTREELIGHEQLTEEEMVIAKKLTRKIDIRIMPLVILVYLMNYIDRYQSPYLSG
jgi:hypothetical protein